jgi:hypothetical protein
VLLLTKALFKTYLIKSEIVGICHLLLLWCRRLRLNLLTSHGLYVIRRLMNLRCLWQVTKEVFCLFSYDSWILLHNLFWLLLIDWRWWVLLRMDWWLLWLWRRCTWPLVCLIVEKFWSDDLWLIPFVLNLVSRSTLYTMNWNVIWIIIPHEVCTSARWLVLLIILQIHKAIFIRSVWLWWLELSTLCTFTLNSDLFTLLFQLLS